jgi:Cu(I)/Ag(I) efflux system membrane protein CusA/SilA
MRQGGNTLEVIGRVKDKLKQLQPGLPKGVEIEPVYDRSQLVRQAIGNLSRTLVEVVVVVSLVIFLFLWHVPSAAIAVITIPTAVLISFLPFHLFGLSANIMSLTGIAIAVGALADASIVVVEQATRSWRNGTPRVAEATLAM